MKRHEFIQSAVRAEMSDKARIREACVNLRTGRETPAETQIRKEKVFMFNTRKWLAPAAACLLIAIAAVAVPNFLKQPSAPAVVDGHPDG
ncbi:MAG: hypothetical protein LBI44_01550 [Oscillospiraceae bacterium]|jgi:hypothetical protein|nr:hypothetical protein [Oscillospiraceae bacterium]